MLQAVKELDEIVVGYQLHPFQTMWCLSGAVIVSESDNCPWWTGEIEEDGWCCGPMEEGMWTLGTRDWCKCPVMSRITPCRLHQSHVATGVGNVDGRPSTPSRVE